MKKYKLLLAISLIVVILISSCYKDKEELLYATSTTGDCSNPSIQKGVKFTAVAAIIQSECVSCHNTGGESPDLSSPCQIVDKWERIKIRCVDKTPSPMPSSPLSIANQNSITDWVNAGHLYTN